MRMHASTIALLLAVPASMAFAGNLLLMQPQRAPGMAGRPAPHQAGQVNQTAALAVPQIDGRAAGTASPTQDGVMQRILVSPPEPDPREVVRSVQRALEARGYETGGADGIAGAVTRAAILAYEADHGLPLTAEPTAELARRIVEGPGSAPRVGAAALAPGVRAEELIRSVQQTLNRLGFQAGKPDGRLGEATIAAIRAFEKQNRMADTGRISGELVARLTRLAREP